MMPGATQAHPILSTIMYETECLHFDGAVNEDSYRMLCYLPLGHEGKHEYAPYLEAEGFEDWVEKVIPAKARL